MRLGKRRRLDMYRNILVCANIFGCIQRRATCYYASKHRLRTAMGPSPGTQCPFDQFHLGNMLPARQFFRLELARTYAIASGVG